MFQILILLLLTIVFSQQHRVLPFVTIFNDILPDRVVKEMRREAEILGPLITGSFWLSKERYRNGVARNFGEYAMQLMKPFLFKELGISDDEESAFVGSEMWYKALNGEAPFHCDKDESLSFQHDHTSLRQPLCVVVLYLDDVGGPTAMLDIAGTSNTSWSPDLPQFAAISLPKTNKAMLFNGSQIHAVLKENHSQQTRVTFIHNLWLNKRPMPPYCVENPTMPKQVTKRFQNYLKKIVDTGKETRSKQPSCFYHCCHNSALPEWTIGDKCLNSNDEENETMNDMKLPQCERKELNDHPQSNGMTIVRPVDGYAYGKQAVRIRIKDVDDYSFNGELNGETLVYRLDDEFTEMIDNNENNDNNKDEL